MNTCCTECGLTFPSLRERKEHDCSRKPGFVAYENDPAILVSLNRKRWICRGCGMEAYDLEHVSGFVRHWCPTPYTPQSSSAHSIPAGDRIKEALPLGTVFLHAGTHMTVVGHDGSNGYDHSYIAICVEYRDMAGIIHTREYPAHMADVFARSRVDD